MECTAIGSTAYLFMNSTKEWRQLESFVTA